jgi:outer membrane protein
MKPSQLTFFILAALIVNQASATDLLEMYRAATTQDPLLASARASQRAGIEKSAQGRALLLPNVSLTANSTYNDVNTQYTGGSRTTQYNNSGFGISLVQPLYRHQNWVLYSEAELQVAISESQYKLAENDLVLRVAQRYFDVLIAEDTVQLIAAQKLAITEQLQQVKRNFEVGTSTITDTYEVQARFDLVNAQEISAQNNLEVARQSLQQIISVSPGILTPLGKGFKMSQPLPVEVESWLADAQQHNFQILIAEASMQLAEKELSRAFDGHMPTLDLVASYSFNSANGGTFTGVGFGAADTQQKNIGVQLNVPLYQGGATQSKFREAEAVRDKAKKDLDNVRRSVVVQTRQAYLGVISGISQVQALEQALKSSESLLESSKVGQSVGVRTNLDVLNAQQQLFSTRRDLRQAEYAYLMSQLRLKAAVGNLTEEDIIRVNQALH